MNPNPDTERSPLTQPGAVTSDPWHEWRTAPTFTACSHPLAGVPDPDPPGGDPLDDTREDLRLSLETTDAVFEAFDRLGQASGPQDASPHAPHPAALALKEEAGSREPVARWRHEHTEARGGAASTQRPPKLGLPPRASQPIPTPPHQAGRGSLASGHGIPPVRVSPPAPALPERPAPGKARRVLGRFLPVVIGMVSGGLLLAGWTHQSRLHARPDGAARGAALERPGPMPALEADLGAYVTRAEQGDPVAMRMMAVFYREGIGTRPDAEAARCWQTRADHVPVSLAPYLRRAESGDPLAMRMLALVHLEGLGVPRDATEAQRWLAMARHAESTPAGPAPEGHP